MPIGPGHPGGEPVVDYHRDDAKKLAAVTIHNLIRRHQQPHVEVVPHKDGRSPRIHISNVHEDSEPVVEWQLGEDGHPEQIVVSNVCLARCTDEPGRMSDVDIECHAIDMAIIALNDRKAKLLMTPAQLEKQHQEALAAVARLERLRK